MTQTSPRRTVRPPGRHRLSPLFEPTSVALVGASDRNGWSGLVHSALSLYGFGGTVYYVNPRGGTAHDQPLATSLSALPEVPDLVFVMVPAPAVLGVLEEAARLGTPAAEILSSGFAEVGGEGVALQNRVARLAAESGMAVLGPNNLGFANVTSRIGLTPTVGTGPLPAGRIAMISQSGNLAGQISTLARTFDVGLSLIASTGNEVDVTVGDIIDYLVEDEPTAAIGVFAETLRRPDEFRAACERAHRAGKPVIVLKAGRSEAAARSALAHTGALVGDDAVVDAALASAGVIRVDTLEDLLATADVFTRIGPVHGRKLGIVSISGGAGDIAGDLAEPLDLELPALAPETVRALQEVLPDYGTAQNPLDMTGAVVAQQGLFGDGLRILATDPGIDAVLAITEADHLARTLDDGMLPGLLDAAAGSPVPALLTSTTVHAFGERTIALRRERDMPAVGWGIDRTLAALARLADHAERPLRAPAPDAAPVALDSSAAGTWSEARSRLLLAGAGVPVVPAQLITDTVSVEPGSYALKIVSADLPHKSDVGGVRLDVPAADVPAAVADMLRAVAAARPAARLDGVLVGPMRRGGVELIVGVVRDAEWGPVLAIGMGGVWTEVLGDVQRVALPADDRAIERALRRLRCFPLLDGARGTDPIDLADLVRTIAAIADLAVRLGPRLAALEVNPLRAAADGIEALDALVVWND